MPAEGCENSNAGNDETPENTGGKNSAERIGAPECSESKVDGEEKEEEGKKGFERFLLAESFKYIIYIYKEVFKREGREEEEGDER